MSDVIRMEWLKLRSVRSTWYIVAAFTAALVGVAMLVLSHDHWTQMTASGRASFDPVNDSYTGLALGQLLFGALGVLAVSSEFASGLIRSTFAAVPSRPRVLAAKTVITGVVTLAAGEIAAFAAYAAGEMMLTSPAPHATLGQPGVLRAVLMAGAYPALIALIGLGLGAIIRHTAGAICALVGVLFVLPLLFVTPALQNAGQNFLPHPMANALTAVKALPHTLPPGLVFSLLCAYAMAALAAGAWALTRHDA
jgi:ABC-2 type transport system permease protein